MALSIDGTGQKSNDGEQEACQCQEHQSRLKPLAWLFDVCHHCGTRYLVGQGLALPLRWGRGDSAGARRYPNDSALLFGYLTQVISSVSAKPGVVKTLPAGFCRTPNVCGRKQLCDDVRLGSGVAQGPTEIHGAHTVARFKQPLANLAITWRRSLQLEKIARILEALHVVRVSGLARAHSDPNAILAFVPELEADVRERADVQHAPQSPAHSPLR
mmetsp:Transcript_3249/g.7684  ORF Transcript_3249/g.7684 Transcript_3249/m.7684 type:complete len:215 (-) Transcript_3249:686-1330(-)